MRNKPKEGSDAEISRLVEVGDEKVGEEKHREDGEADGNVVFASGREGFLLEGSYGDLGAKDKMRVGDNKYGCQSISR